jgi:uncharacterized protein with von Willebrand factor type A (vWA) domain
MSTTAANLLAFFEDLRSEGVAVGTSEILDAFAALDEVSWTDQRDFRESLAATIAKSQEDRRIFELLFDRHFFRAAETEALEKGIEDERFEGAGDRIDLDELREAIRRAIFEGNDGEMRDLARLAMTAFGPTCAASSSGPPSSARASFPPPGPSPSSTGRCRRARPRT